MIAFLVSIDEQIPEPAEYLICASFGILKGATPCWRLYILGCHSASLMPAW